MSVDVFSYEGLSIHEAIRRVAAMWRNEPHVHCMIVPTLAEGMLLEEELRAHGVPVRFSSPLEREAEFTAALNASGACVHLYLDDTRNGSLVHYVDVFLPDAQGNLTTECRVTLLHGTDLYFGTSDGAGSWHVLATATRDPNTDTLHNREGLVSVPDTVWASILDALDRSLRGEPSEHGDA